MLLTSEVKTSEYEYLFQEYIPVAKCSAAHGTAPADSKDTCGRSVSMLLSAILRMITAYSYLNCICLMLCKSGYSYVRECNARL